MRLFTSELVKKYKSRTVVNHVTIDVKQGEIVGLLGPNGAGKTTTFYMIVGLIKPNEGQIFLEDDNGKISELTNEPVYRRAQMGVGYLAQEASVFRRLSVEDNIKAVLEMTSYSKEYQRERCESLIEEFRLQKVRKSLGIQLSGGERRRTEIARAVAINPAFILLDEPFAGVDPIAVEDIQSIVATLKNKNIGVIITDHNMDKSVSVGSVKGIIAPPSSKSYAQRAIALALLAQGKSILRNIEFCKDTRSALSCIEALGANVEVLDHNTIAIEGGLRPQTNTLQVGESGLATRLFTPIASLWHEAVTIQGEGTLLHRPMIMMIEPLRALGVEVRDGGGYLPIEVKGPIHGGEIEVDGSISSQFITGLLLSLPLAEDDTTLHVTSPVSTPYIDMTIDTARLYGIEIMQKEGDYTEFFIEGGQKYTPADISIEGDWSGASSMLVAGAIAGEVTVKNISTLSKQADTAIIRALERAGAGIINEQDSITVSKRPLKAFTFDATNAPDLFPALAALAAAAEGVSTIIGTSRLRHKESDRAETLRQEYEKLGIEIDISEENVMKIRGGKIKPAAVFSHGDHRIAMSLAISALRCEGEVIIEQAESVEKSYPTFFEDLESIIQR